MKLKAKFFLCTIIVLSVSLSLTGYFFISFSFESSIEREELQAVNQYQLTKFALQSNMLAYDFDWSGEDSFFENLNLNLDGEETSAVAVYNEERELLYSTFADFSWYVFPEEVDESHLVYRILTADRQYQMTVTGYFEQDGRFLYLITAADITPIFQAKNEMMGNFILIYLVVLSVGVLAVLCLSAVIFRPIKQMIRKTREIAEGNFSERIRIQSADELGVLGESFNIMAETVEQTIRELELSVQQKEAFISNFAHEMKTPLTSVIGYADMIYQRDLSRGEIKSAASYIMNEGLRLEALSTKLMDLIVLNRNDFTREILAADELLENIAETLKPLCEKRNVPLVLHAEHAYIKVEFDLFKTMILNFVDNALKADPTTVHLIGRTEEKQYAIYIFDDGIGIPREELNKITDAFYMVDKSRSRKHHGAGLGLTLAKKIADIHGADFQILSKEGTGSCILLRLNLEEEAESEE